MSEPEENTQADAVLAKMPARTGVAVVVRRALASRMASTDTRMSSIARQLGMSERTLQRRLSEDGVSYQDLLDEVKKATAGRYLDESPLTIGEIAYLLGYSEPPPFIELSGDGTRRRRNTTARVHADHPGTVSREP
jgi:AraC-like DNA-binding protein